MAGPTAALTFMTKKLVFDLLTEPQKVLKLVLLFIFLPLFILILFFAVPWLFSVSIPTVLIDGNVKPEALEKQLEIIQMYHDGPIVANEKTREWVQETIRTTPHDELELSYNFNITWQQLMAIDTVLLKQDFTGANMNDIVSLADKFITKDSYTYTYKKLITETIRYRDDDGNWVTETISYWIEVKVLVITVDTKPFADVINSMPFNSLDKQVIQNIYKTIANADIEGNLNIYDEDLGNLSEYPAGSANIPYFHQADRRWGNYSYGSSTIAQGGCGPTSLAMVVAGLTGRVDINPKTIADWSVDNGHRADGSGSYWSLMTEGARNYGLKVEQVSRRNPSKIVQALSEGYPVIVSMGPGHFTRGGHFIVLRGITEDGKILVYDPASVSRSQKAWDLSIIMSESSTNGGSSGSPFWIFKP